MRSDPVTLRIPLLPPELPRVLETRSWLSHFGWLENIHVEETGYGSWDVVCQFRPVLPLGFLFVREYLAGRARVRFPGPLGSKAKIRLEFLINARDYRAPQIERALARMHRDPEAEAEA